MIDKIEGMQIMSTWKELLYFDYHSVIYVTAKPAWVKMKGRELGRRQSV